MEGEVNTELEIRLPENQSYNVSTKPGVLISLFQHVTLIHFTAAYSITHNGRLTSLDQFVKAY